MHTGLCEASWHESESVRATWHRSDRAAPIRPRFSPDLIEASPSIWCYISSESTFLVTFSVSDVHLNLKVA